MATERVGIYIDLMGYEDAMSNMQNLDRMIHGLQGRKTYMKIKAEIDQLKMNREALRSHKVKIKADMADVDKKIEHLRGRMRRLKELRLRVSDQGTIDKIDKRLNELGERMRRLGMHKADLGSQFRQTADEIQQCNARLNQLRAGIQNAGLASKSLRDIFKGSSTAVGHLGAAMQSAGNAITRMTYPLRMFTSGALMGAGFGAMTKVTEGLKSGFERYDIMKKYNRLMKDFEKGNYTAKKSIDDLDKSVQGLPTGLDEMVSLAQRFTMTTGDMKKGTELAIATNNAFLASMATDTQRYQGMMQMQDVLSGKDMNAREWYSLAGSMMPAIRMMGESLGKTGKELDQYVADVQQGKIANEDFIKTLREAGQEGGKIYKAAQQSKDTWQAFSARIGTAFSRMTYGVLTSLDEIVKAATGGKFESLNSLLDDKFIPTVNSMTESVKGWIKANPEKITGFFDSLKGIDWAGLGRGFVKGIGEIVNTIKKLVDVVGGGKNMAAIGRFIAWLPAIGSGLTIIGGLIKGTRHIWGGLASAAVGIGRVLGGLGAVSIGGKLAKLGETLKTLFSIKSAADMADTAMKGKKPLVNAKRYFLSLGKSLAGVAAGIGIAVGSTWGLKTSLKQLKEISILIKEIDWNALKPLGEAALGISTVVSGLAVATQGVSIKPGAIAKAFVPIGEFVLGVGGVITEILAFGAIDTALMKKSMQNLVDITGDMQTVFNNVGKLSGGISEGQLSGLRESVSSLFDIYDIIYGEKKPVQGAQNKATGYVQKRDKGLMGMDKGAIKKIKGAVEGMGETIKLMGQIDTSLKGMKGFKGFDSKIVDSLSQFVGDLGSIYDELKQAFEQNFGEKDAEEFAGIMSQTKTMFNNFAQIGKMLPQLASSLFGAMSRGGGTGMGKSSMDIIKEQLVGENGMFAGIRSIYESIYDNLLGYKGGLNGFQLDSGMIAEIEGSMKGVVGMFNSINEMVAIIPSLTKGMKPLSQGASPGSGASAFTVLKNQIVQMMKGVGEIVQTINTAIPDVGDIESKTGNLVTAITNIKKTASKLASLGEGTMAGTDGAAFTAINNIKEMISQLGKALNTEVVAQIQADVESFKASIDNLFNTLNKDLAHVKVTVNIEGRVDGVGELISKIGQAKSRIMAAVRSIPNSITRHVYIHVTPHVNVGKVSIPKASDIVPPHTGGYIAGGSKLLYKAQGGGIGNIFKPRGTDTVPAMLTPGEYVLRKRAVDTFGVRFLQKLNSIDVAGAMRELSARASMNSAISRGTTIYNNITTNNNPIINQNIRTSNPNFAFKRSRAVMSL